jgi:hypothetical protein
VYIELHIVNSSSTLQIWSSKQLHLVAVWYLVKGLSAQLSLCIWSNAWCTLAVFVVYYFNTVFPNCQEVIFFGQKYVWQNISMRKIEVFYLKCPVHLCFFSTNACNSVSVLQNACKIFFVDWLGMQCRVSPTVFGYPLLITYFVTSEILEM